MSGSSYRDSLRATVLAKAGGLLEAEGIEAIQARRIAREAGCAVGTLYNLFGDIDGLILALNAETLSMLEGHIRGESAALDGLALEGRLATLALGYMQFASTYPRRWEAVFKHRLPTERPAPASYLEDQACLLSVIDIAIGEAVPDADERAATARALFGAVHGIVALALDNRLGGKLKDELEPQLRRIARLLARGLEVR